MIEQINAFQLNHGDCIHHEGRTRIVLDYTVIDFRTRVRFEDGGSILVPAGKTLDRVTDGPDEVTSR